MDITFFMTADTHIDVQFTEQAKKHVANMNVFGGGGKVWPEGTYKAGQVVNKPGAVLLAGDIKVDRGFVNSEEVVKLTYELYSGKNRKEYSLLYPAYPGFGNHDWDPLDWNYTFLGNTSNGAMADFICKTIEGRESINLMYNKSTPIDPFGWVSSAPPLYSFNLGRLHFVNLNTYIGEPKRTVTWFGGTKGELFDNGGYEWLRNDLAQYVNTYGENAPIIIFQHYGYDSFSLPWWPDDARKRMGEIISRYNVIGIFTGHTHGNFNRVKTPEGFDNYVTNAACDYSSGIVGGFLAVNVTDTTVDVIYVNSDGSCAKLDSKNINTGNISWSGQQPISDSAGNSSPALADFNNKLYCAWTVPGGGAGNVKYTSFDGLNWSAPKLHPHPGTTAYNAPSFAVFNNRLYMAWLAWDKRSIWYASTSDGENWDNQQPIGDSAGNSSPALVTFNNKLYCAWTVPGGGAGNVKYTSFDSSKWSAPKLHPHPGTTADNAPALAVFNNRLYMAWIAWDKRFIWYASTSDGENWDSQQPIRDSAGNSSPALVTFRDKLYYAWTVPGGGAGNVKYTSFDGSKWSAPKLHPHPGTTADNAPTLAVFNNCLYMAWIAWNKTSVWYSSAK